MFQVHRLRYYWFAQTQSLCLPAAWQLRLLPGYKKHLPDMSLLLRINTALRHNGRPLQRRPHVQHSPQAKC